MKRRLKEEWATLTRFDTELRDLDEVIKVMKQDADDVDISIKKLEHEVQALAKDKAGHLMGAVNLERQHDWIEEESQWVKRRLPSRFSNHEVCSASWDRRMILTRLILVS
jgi:predicted  nucleic acid-binding Zn-ribbon protein